VGTAPSGCLGKRQPAMLSKTHGRTTVQHEVSFGKKTRDKSRTFAPHLCACARRAHITHKARRGGTRLNGQKPPLVAIWARTGLCGQVLKVYVFISTVETKAKRKALQVINISSSLSYFCVVLSFFTCCESLCLFLCFHAPSSSRLGLRCLLAIPLKPHFSSSHSFFLVKIKT